MYLCIYLCIYVCVCVCVCVCVYGWMNEWLDEEKVEWRGERIDDWLYKRLEGRIILMAEWMDKRMDG